MLRNGVTPMPPAIQIWRRFARSRLEKDPYAPSTTASAPGSSVRNARV